jgi:membrane associated rhomboid family serine protease
MAVAVPSREEGTVVPSPVAFFAHVGGFIFGLLVARLLARPGQTAPGELWRPTA